MAGHRSLYDVLNVAPEAEPVVVEAAYKALIKKYHPDQALPAPVSVDAAAINEAFAILKDPGRRADYDHRLWAKQQALRLAELKAAGGSSRPRFSALGGWLVAGLLACALAAVAVGKSLPPRPQAASAQAAEPEDVEAPARAAAAEAAAAEAAHDRRVISSAAVLARVHAERAASAPSLRREAPPPRGSAAPRHRKSKRPAAVARAKPAQEPDFLEREGYIY
jgi:curved DNA-binding protein CbpA